MQRRFCPLFALVFALAVLLAGPARGQKSHESVREFIFTSAPFASCHASTLVELKNGDLLAAWFGGSAEGNPDVAIWMSRRSHGRWSTPSEAVREPGTPTWNPVLFFTRDGRLWLYYKFGRTVRSWTAGRLWSDDQGRTWSAPEHLPAGLYGPIKDKPLVLQDGTVVSGSSVESYGSWAAWIERSTDNGRSWRRIGPITVPQRFVHGESPSGATTRGTEVITGIIQPTVIALTQQHLRLYARPTSNIGRICAADSYDAGRTWTRAHPLDLPNPNSGIDAVRMRDGRIVLVYNATPTGRTPLNLAVSRDGLHFTMFDVLEDRPGEYSYPAIIQNAKGDLDITYTWRRKRIRFVEEPQSMVPQ